jgi:hypothetical protein
MEEDNAAALSQEVVAKGFDAYEAIDKGLSNGMERAGVLFEEEEYFIPELLMCSDAMYAGLDVLKPHIKTDEQAHKYKIVIGVIEGDTHDIGKNLVKIMLESSGFEVVDLGRDIPPAQFVEKAVETKAKVGSRFAKGLGGGFGMRCDLYLTANQMSLQLLVSHLTLFFTDCVALVATDALIESSVELFIVVQETFHPFKIFIS